MAVQQASLFFNDSPEERREKQPLSPKQGELQQLTSKNEPPEDLIVEKPLMVETAPETQLIVVDEVIREIELEPVVSRVKKEKPEKKSGRGRMRLSDMDVLVDLVEVPEDEVLFGKSYYGISEVSNMFKVNISLIRFWENEFAILKPKKNGKGDRLFRPEDIKNLQLIYHLLREKKYTIDGAKDFLKKNKKAEETFELIESLKKTKAFLLDLKANL